MNKADSDGCPVPGRKCPRSLSSDSLLPQESARHRAARKRSSTTPSAASAAGAVGPQLTTDVLDADGDGSWSSRLVAALSHPLSFLSSVDMARRAAASVSAAVGAVRGMVTAMRTGSIVPTGDALASAVAAIRAKKVTVTEAGHLRLPDDLRWPCATSNLLFVRKYYAPLFESVIEGCRPARPGEPEENRRLVVTGQPGIGKSVWGWYVIYRLLTEQPWRTVIYASNKHNEVFVIPPAGQPIFKTLLSQLQVVCTRVAADAVLIADSFVPPLTPFPTLVISSPGPLTIRALKDTLNDYHSDFIYMPVPTEEEVLQMRALAFPHLDEAAVKARMALWGPIPRNVLVKISSSAQSKALGAAQSITLRDLIRVASSLPSGKPEEIAVDGPHRILHERAAGQDAPPDADAANIRNRAFYDRGVVAIASPPFLRFIAERIKEKKAWYASSLIDASLGIGALGTLRGLTFEEFVLSQLEEGQTFKCRDLETGEETSVTFPECARLVWKDAAQLQAMRGRTAGHLLVPKKRNNAGLDGLMWDPAVEHHWPLDCTVAASHSLNATGLAAALSALGWTARNGWPSHKGPRGKSKLIKYYWFVPEDRYQFGWSSPCEMTGAADAAAVAAYTNTKQYAIAVPPAATITRVAAACERQGVPKPGDALNDIKRASNDGTR